MITNPTNEHKEQARAIVAVWKRDIGQVVKYERMEADIATALCSRDTEIRNVLEGLAKWVNDEWCWCPQVARDGNGALIHFNACVRTSALYAKLQGTSHD